MMAVRKAVLKGDQSRKVKTGEAAGLPKYLVPMGQGQGDVHMNKMSCHTLYTCICMSPLLSHAAAMQSTACCAQRFP